MQKYKTPLIIANLLLVLAFVNFSIVKKEQTISSGELVLLELSPLDPRSLMQGDYMALRYKIAVDSVGDALPKHGYCVVKLDANHVATRARLQATEQPLNAGEFLIKFKTVNGWDMQLGAESFFFEEGQSEKFSAAKYGALRIDDGGNSVLVGMYDGNLKKIE